MCLARMCGKALAMAPISSGGRDIAAATSLMALLARYVSIMQTQAVRAAPYASMMIRYASSRRADSTSRSMSGIVARTGDRNRSMSRSCSIGSIALMPSRWLTKLPAPEPRTAQRMPRALMRSATSATVRK